MQTKENTFQQYLSSKGLKFTRERQSVLQEAFSTHRHFEVDDLFIRLRRKGFRVSRATLYRTLELLVESQLLREVITGERHRHYEHIFGHGHHDHLVCVKCGKTIEFTDASIEHSENQVCREYGFLATGHRLQIMGYCRKCR